MADPSSSPSPSPSPSSPPLSECNSPPIRNENSNVSTKRSPKNSPKRKYLRKTFKSLCINTLHWSKGDWTEEEDELLIELYNRIGCDWMKISSLLGTRSNKQCRNRYVSVLEPRINGERGIPWTIYEDLIIISNYPKYHHSWMDYTQHLAKRTNDDIKNRWLKTLSVDEKRGYYNQFLDLYGNIIQCSEIYEVSPKWYLHRKI
ncbi:hypothetical protein PPL_04662 [Heterostelium album PN500]|uniref:Myb-like DNA-binding domain containing protein n=1 Tax=Heterostelium pallidum (strain ATCC 26659 / Pp 5 / PN500) TaxID=670386 RepID=D3B871_HETP5|nr:hypothetical protein PPL_04662 [Heterostelium album PN500]EFA82239.1 hypothetical protein PPL_04662 [Heterostelium album PN500]|eukprot:XP_020434356.1 hypothetical protein PPL_04662 [Heterostelium album PN500]